MKFGNLHAHEKIRIFLDKNFNIDNSSFKHLRIRFIIETIAPFGINQEMKNYTLVLKWVTDCLSSKGCPVKSSEIFLETPWSTILKISTLKGDFFLKKNPPAISKEAQIIQLLANKFHASVPTIIAANDNLHCFLMENAGHTLREYLKIHFQPELLCEAIKQFTAIQNSTKSHVDSFFALGVPDWRIKHLPNLYNQLISQTDILKDNDLTDDEIQKLDDLRPQVFEQCELLLQYSIPDTIVQPDFNTNNILFDPINKKMTLIDLGELAISHPFFSLINFLYQATIHHNVKVEDSLYQKLEESCFKEWNELATKKQLKDAFQLAKKLWHIYAALASYRLIESVDSKALKLFYSNRNKPNPLANSFRQYIANS